MIKQITSPYVWLPAMLAEGMVDAVPVSVSGEVLRGVAMGAEIPEEVRGIALEIWGIPHIV